ncbi:MAG: hypothetical protein K2Q45_03140 [Nitrosomonas sp.]|nr:hypothetical protein [Nitrosomonas sp.]
MLDDAWEQHVKEKSEADIRALVPFIRGDGAWDDVVSFFRSKFCVHRHYCILLYFKRLLHYKKHHFPLPLCLEPIATKEGLLNDLGCATWFWDIVDREMESLEAKKYVFAILCKYRNQTKITANVVEAIDWHSTTEAQKLWTYESTVLELFPLLRTYVKVHLPMRFSGRILNKHAGNTLGKQAEFSIPYLGSGRTFDASHFIAYCESETEGQVQPAGLLEAIPFIKRLLLVGMLSRYTHPSDQVNHGDKIYFFHV